MSEIEWKRELQGKIGWHETNGRDMKEVRKRESDKQCEKNKKTQHSRCQ